jgi:S1-C subfamily serine protease
MLLSKLFSILYIAIIIVGCDDSRSNKQNLNISIKIENLSKENQNLYSKIQENDKSKLKELIQKAEDNDLEASKVLGFLYLQGKFIKRNIDKGIHHIKRSADDGDKEAALILYKLFISPKFKDDHKDEAKKYADIAGLTSNDTNRSKKTIKTTADLIRENPWPELPWPEDRLIASGSGVAINENGYFVTNRHVVDGCGKVLVRYNGMFAKSTSVILGQDADVAIVKVQYKTPAFVNIIPNKPELGDRIFVGGYPLVTRLGSELKITDGLISGTDQKRPSFVQISASISSGNSGGPVVNENNSLIGIATGGISPGQSNDVLRGHGINFATHSVVITTFLKNNNVDFDTNVKKETYTSKQIAESLKLTSSIILCFN